MATRLPSWLRQHLAAVRALLVLTVLVGLAYPLVVTGIAQIPGLKSKADGSIVTADGRDVGSSQIGQAFTDDKGDAIPKYFQSRPSAAGDGYDPTATSASNLGPESIVDVPDDPATAEDDSKPSLLTQVCARSLAVGKLEGVDGARPYCTPGGVGAVLAVFHAGPGYAGGVTRVVSVNEYCDTTPTPFLATYQGVRGRVPPARRGPQPRSGGADPRGRTGEPGRARRRGHRQRQRVGPGHQPGIREPAGAAGGEDPQPPGRPGPPAHPGSHRGARVGLPR